MPTSAIQTISKQQYCIFVDFQVSSAQIEPNRQILNSMSMCLPQTKQPVTNITPTQWLRNTEQCLMAKKHNKTKTKTKKKQYQSYRNPQNKENAVELFLHHRTSSEQYDRRYDEGRRVELLSVTVKPSSDEHSSRIKKTYLLCICIRIANWTTFLNRNILLNPVWSKW